MDPEIDPLTRQIEEIALRTSPDLVLIDHSPDKNLDKLINRAYTLQNEHANSHYDRWEDIDAEISTLLTSGEKTMLDGLSTPAHAHKLLKMLISISKEGYESPTNSISQFLKRNILTIEANLKVEDIHPQILKGYLDLIFFASDDNPDDQFWGLEVLRRNFPDVKKLLEKDRTAGLEVMNLMVSRERYLKYLEEDATENFQYSDLAEATLKREVLGDNLSNLDLEKAISDISDLYYIASQNRGEFEVDSQWQELILPILSKFGLNDPSLIEAWSNLTENFNPINENMSVILELESQRPNSASLLNREFGIKQFGRYPVEMLIRQYDQFSKNDKPYGLLIAAEDDPKGNFYAHKPIWRQLSDVVEGDYYLRIVELKNKSELEEQSQKLRNRYGQQRRVSFAVIAAHGRGDSFKLSDDQAGEITKDDLDQPLFQLFMGDFVPHPFLLFISCSTGVEGGIAQAWSEKGNGVTIATKNPATVRKLERASLYGQYIILPTYGHSYASFEKAPTGGDFLRIYDRGQRVPFPSAT